MHTLSWQLVTMGGQHQGVATLPGCWQADSGTNSTPSLYCRWMQARWGNCAACSLHALAHCVLP